MQATIYINKANQKFWKKLKNKSGFINTVLALEQHGEKHSHEFVGALKDTTKKILEG